MMLMKRVEFLAGVAATLAMLWAGLALGAGKQDQDLSQISRDIQLLRLQQEDANDALIRELRQEHRERETRELRELERQRDKEQAERLRIRVTPMEPVPGETTYILCRSAIEVYGADQPDVARAACSSSSRAEIQQILDDIRAGK